ncbi:MAG TPA: hypothetical protein VIT91_02425 [Chthoniobacterales bacterium]
MVADACHDVWLDVASPSVGSYPVRPITGKYASAQACIKARPASDATQSRGKLTLRITPRDWHT